MDGPKGNGVNLGKGNGASSKAREQKGAQLNRDIKREMKICGRDEDMQETKRD